MYDADSLVLRDVLLLILVEEVGGLECVISANRDQRVDPEIAERVVDVPELLGLFGVQQIGRTVDARSRVGASGADDDAPAVANPPDVGGQELSIMLRLDHPVVVAVVVLKVCVAMENPEHLDAGL